MTSPGDSSVPAKVKRRRRQHVLVLDAPQLTTDGERELALIQRLDQRARQDDIRLVAGAERMRADVALRWRDVEVGRAHVQPLGTALPDGKDARLLLGRGLGRAHQELGTRR
jgi:hypothetical protein